MENQELNITDLITNFNDAKTAAAPLMSRIIRNTLATCGVEGSSYTPEQRAYLDREGMEPTDYNFLSKYVKGITGSIMGSWFQPKFSALDSATVSPDMITAINAVYSADKDLNSFKSVATQTVFDGANCIGVEEILIDRPSLANPRTWSIKFESLKPESIIFVASDKAGKISDTAQEAYKYSYPSMNDIEKIYPDKKEEIEQMINGLQGQDQFDRNYSVYNTILDSDEELRHKKYQVVEYYHMVNERIKKRVYVPTWEILPDGINGDKTADNLSLHIWALERGIELNEEDILIVEDIIPTLYVDVFIPDLQIILDSGKDERQIGRLPFYAWSYLENNGVPIGVVDLLWNTAQDLLKREKAKTKYIEKTPTAKPWVHPDIVGNDAGKLSKVLSEWNDSSKPLVVDSEVTPGLVERLMGIERGVDIPQAILHDENFKLNLMDQLSGLTPSMQGVTERSGESGIMFQRKVLESTNQQRVPLLSLSQHEKLKAEGWLKLAQTVYGGKVNINREIALPKDRGILKINEFVGYDDEGQELIEYDFSDLSRVDVVIGKSPETDFYRQATRSSDLDMLKIIRPTPTNSEIIASIENNLILSMDFANDEERKNVEVAVARRSELEKLNAQAQISKLQSAVIQGETAEMMAEVDQALTPLVAQNKAIKTKIDNTGMKGQLTQMQQQNITQGSMPGGGPAGGGPMNPNGIPGGGQRLMQPGGPAQQVKPPIKQIS